MLPSGRRRTDFAKRPTFLIWRSKICATRVLAESLNLEWTFRRLSRLAVARPQANYLDMLNLITRGPYHRRMQKSEQYSSKISKTTPQPKLRVQWPWSKQKMPNKPISSSALIKPEPGSPAARTLSLVECVVDFTVDSPRGHKPRRQSGLRCSTPETGRRSTAFVEARKQI